jgi:hypothetical protein
VLVHFLADQFEGQREWVPPGRLKVLWSELEDFIARERRWRAIVEASTPRNSAVYLAVVHVFEELIDRTTATTGSNRTEGLSWIHDVDQLARFLSFRSDELLAHPASFVDNDAFIVPWPITQLIARQAARLNPDPILRLVDDEESAYRFRTMHGQAFGGARRDRGGYVDAGRFAQEFDKPYNQPCWQTLRTWCGVEASGTHDELRALRRELARVRELAEDGIAGLRQARRGGEADRIARELNVGRC